MVGFEVQHILTVVQVVTVLVVVELGKLKEFFYNDCNFYLGDLNGGENDYKCRGLYLDIYRKFGSFLSEKLLIKTSCFFTVFNVCLIISKTQILGRDKKQIILLIFYLRVSSVDRKKIY
jgi:hypothetical protein